MPRIEKDFKDLKLGEAFSCNYAKIVYCDDPFCSRPRLWICTGDDSGVFLPTGEIDHFKSDERVKSTEVAISEV